MMPRPAEAPTCGYGGHVQNMSKHLATKRMRSPSDKLGRQRTNWCCDVAAGYAADRGWTEVA